MMDKQRRFQKKRAPNRLMADELDEFLNDVRESGILVVVEGFKDKQALNALGITNVFSLDRMPLYKVVETVAKRAEECMILTDLDKEGKKLYSRLSHDLGQHGVRIENRFREFLFKHTSLRQIEGLDTFFRNSAIGNCGETY